ncbi:MAG: MGMT family protein [Myxococcaceae bacterium]|nr:MGMT family protein [Myxococcaceae bacterium]
MSPFEKTVAAVIRAIPKGSTLSYAGVALRANKPLGARQVVRALHTLKAVPWWRVIRSDGTLAEPVANEQARRLRREGVKVTGQRVYLKTVKKKLKKPLR